MLHNLTPFQEKLTEEKILLEKELANVGRKNPDRPGDWEATAGVQNEPTAEIEERASEITSFEDRSAIEMELEERYNEVLSALVRIDNNTYGICSVCKKPIEEDRLHANPAARTCKADRDLPLSSLALK